MSYQELKENQELLTNSISPQKYIKRYQWRNYSLEDSLLNYSFIHYPNLKKGSYYHEELDYGDIKGVRLYADVPNYLALVYNDELPVAFLGYEKKLLNSRKLKVGQIQGTKFFTKDDEEMFVKRKGNEFLRGFDWKLALLDAFEDFSSYALNAKAIEVLSANNNEYVGIHQEFGGNKGIPKDRAEQIYDRTAILKGYEKNKRSNYEKIFR